MQRVKIAIVGRRIMGALLVLLVTVPFYRLLDSPVTGLAGRSTVGLSELNAAALWYGALLALIPVIVLARVLEPRLIDRWVAILRARLLAPRSATFALVLALLAGALTLAFSLGVLEGKPNLIDAMSQLLHARYLAAGKLAGPVLPEGAFWHIQNTVITDQGWVSQYPPGHVVLLAIGFRLGAVWLIGPMMVAVAILFTALTAERLLPDDRATARLGAIMAALSPFLIGLAGAYMNHITAAAFGAAAVYCAVRTRDGNWAWALPTGAALAWVFGTRPLAGVVVGAVVAFAVWWDGGGARLSQPGRWLARVAWATAGASPFLILLGAYNNHFFGRPWRFGYSAALGPATALGFHQDPWGNWYGPLQALGYTSADLVALNLNLLESPVPVVLLAGLFLLFARKLSTGERIIAAWALLTVLGNLFYWHHGLFMGPRMLNEAAPAWALLTAVAAVGIVRRIPPGFRVIRGGYSVRVAVLLFLVGGGVVGYLVLAPQRLLSYGAERHAGSRVRVPEVSGPAIVFVHGAWEVRAGMRLAASGMRLDSLETALRQNPTCRVAEYVAYYVARSEGNHSAKEVKLDLTPRSDDFPPRIEISPGNWILVAEDSPLTEECLREIEADRNGVVDVTPLAWQGDLPELDTGGAMYVRDLGPESNEELIRRHPERKPLVFYTPSSDASPILMPYQEGMAAIWGGSAARAGMAQPDITVVP